MTATAGPTSEIPQVRLPAAAPAAGASDPSPAAAPAAESVSEQPSEQSTEQPSGKKSTIKRGRPAKSAPNAPRGGKGPKSKPAVAQPARPKSRPGAPSTSLVIGGMPKVDLLPLSIRVLDKQKRARRTMRLAAVGVAVIVFAGTAGAWYLNMTAQQELAEAQSASTSLLQQQSQYSDLVTVNRQIDLTTAAQAVGGATDVNWRDYLATLQSTLPSGVVLKTVTIDSAAPGTTYEQSTTPLEGMRVATLTFTAISPSLPDVPNWLNGLRTLDAFVDATPNSVQLDDTDNTYLVEITMHVNADIYSNRFAATGTDAQ